MKQKSIKPLITPIPSPDPKMLRASLLLSVSATSQDALLCTDPLNILAYDYSYLTVNTGDNPVAAYLQISPDSTTWETQSAIKIIPPKTMASFVSNVIARYARLCYQSQKTGYSTTLIIYIQGR